MRLTNLPDWAIKRLASARILVGEVSVANAVRICALSLSEFVVAAVFLSGVVWNVVPAGDPPTPVVIFVRLIGALAFAQAIALAWIGVQTIRDLRAREIPFTGQYVRSVRGSDESYNRFLDETGLSPKYAVPIVLRVNVERQDGLFAVPLSYSDSLIALDSSRRPGELLAVEGSYFPHTHLIRDLLPAGTNSSLPG